jgi:Ca2+-transporting ATPase
LGSDLDSWNDQELKDRIRDIDIFARVEPQHKLRIVAAWQKQGEVVAMTGDGINDAPAIKAADIGIALGDSTDVTKETADIVLLDNNFKVIVSAIKQGRVIFDNIRKVTLYLLSDSFTEIILIAGAVLMKLPMPLFALQILWINLIADGLPNMAMAAEKGEKGIMDLPPRPRNEPLLNKEMKILIFAISIIVDLVLLSLFVFMLRLNYDLTYIRTLIFAATGFDSLLYAFSVRSLKSSIFTENPFKNKYLVGAVVISFFILISAIYIPFMQILFKTVNLGLNDWIIVVSLAVFKIMLIEMIKQIFINKKKAAPRTA